MADTPPEHPDSEIRKWSLRIGLVTSGLTILTWLGIAGWNDLKAKITGSPADTTASRGSGPDPPVGRVRPRPGRQRAESRWAKATTFAV